MGVRHDLPTTACLALHRISGRDRTSRDNRLFPHEHGRWKALSRSSERLVALFCIYLTTIRTRGMSEVDSRRNTTREFQWGEPKLVRVSL